VEQLGIMTSAIVKRSIVLSGHKTSVSLEDAFWNGLKDIADARKVSVSSLVHEIDATRGENNLSSAVRQFVLGRYVEVNRRRQANPDCESNQLAL
jgi:predicted DNA-binding ribbon-helix-helix protein